MAYPQTKFTLVDNSDIAALDVATEDTIDRPVFGQVFASPKGFEEWQTSIMGQTFFDIYGEKPSFSTYGQAFVQAGEIARNGGRVTCKRVVAPDATLANLLVYAELYKATTQKYDKSGNPIFIDSTGAETIDPTKADPKQGVNGCATAQKAQIKLKVTPYGNSTTSSIGNSIPLFRKAILADANYPGTASDGAAGEIDLNGNIITTAQSAGAVYPLFMIADSGRGESAKAFRIYADTSARRPVNYVRYILVIYDGGVSKETMAFTLNPDIVESNTNISIENVIRTNSKQVRAIGFDDQVKALAKNIAYVANENYSDYINHDILFGLDTYGNVEDTVYVDQTSADFDATTGLALLGGSNGSFGSRPLTTNPDLYNAQVMSTFDGSFSDSIYDLDNFRMDVIFDANYADPIKRKIEELVEFREDVLFFRDMHTGLTTLDAIKMANKNNLASRLCATYENSWDVIDPYTRKQITVTATYSLATLFITHFLNGQTRPFCGLLYNITFPDVIEGTVNFTPKNTPSEDQKQTIDDLRINYAGYYSGTLVMETEYTSQEKFTQLSWINNVLTLQGMIRDIRKKCPRIRYNFLDSDSLKKYMADVQSVIDKHTTDFESIEMAYVDSNVYEQNKIFYAEIKVKMRNFIQSEYFKITVLKG